MKDKKIVVPWFIVGYPPSGIVGASSFLGSVLITTKAVPEMVNDSRPLNYSTIQIPGGHTAMTKFGSVSERKVSFTLKIADFNDDFGVTTMLARFDRLRKPPFSIAANTKASRRSPTATDIAQEAEKTKQQKPVTIDNRYDPFVGNLKVIYYHSTFNVVPMVYYLTKCDWETSKPNGLGKPQYAVVSIDLVQDEASPINVAEEFLSYGLGLTSSAGNAVRLLQDAFSKKGSSPKGNPYRTKSRGIF